MPDRELAIAELGAQGRLHFSEEGGVSVAQHVLHAAQRTQVAHVARHVGGQVVKVDQRVAVGEMAPEVRELSRRRAPGIARRGGTASPCTFGRWGL